MMSVLSTLLLPTLAALFSSALKTAISKEVLKPVCIKLIKSIVENSETPYDDELAKPFLDAWEKSED